MADLVARGAIILVCDFALGHLANRLAPKFGSKPDEVHAALRKGLIPNAYAVPSGIFGLARAQNAGCATFACKLLDTDIWFRPARPFAPTRPRGLPLESGRSPSVLPCYTLAVAVADLPPSSRPITPHWCPRGPHDHQEERQQLG